MEFGIYIMIFLVWIRLGDIKDVLMEIAKQLKGEKQ